MSAKQDLPDKRGLPDKRSFMMRSALVGLITGGVTTAIWLLPGGQIGTGSAVTAGGLAKLILPGLVFGLGLGVWLNRAKAVGVPGVIKFTLAVEAAWFAAYFFAVNFADHWDGIIHGFAETGLLAGLIGAVGVGAALMLGFGVSRQQAGLGIFAVVGAAAGCLLAVDTGYGFLAPLFYVWQAAIAAVCGCAIAGTRT
jgi:hypothetical protein